MRAIVSASSSAPIRRLFFFRALFFFVGTFLLGDTGELGLSLTRADDRPLPFATDGVAAPERPARGDAARAPRGDAARAMRGDEARAVVGIPTGNICALEDQPKRANLEKRARFIPVATERPTVVVELGPSKSSTVAWREPSDRSRLPHLSYVL